LLDLFCFLLFVGFLFCRLFFFFGRSGFFVHFVGVVQLEVGNGVFEQLFLFA